MENTEQNVTTENNNRRKYILWGCLIVFVILVLLLIFFFKKPLTVEFVTNGGTSIDIVAVDDDGHIKVPNNPTRFGWDFEGWYLDAKMTNKIEDLSSYTFTSSTYLYAKWRLHRYTITYVLNGGENNSKNPKEYVIKHSKPEDETWTADFTQDGNTFVPLPNEAIMLSNITIYAPTKEGATFDGWYKTPDFKGSKVTEIQTIEPEDITLYAKWI